MRNPVVHDTDLGSQLAEVGKIPEGGAVFGLLKRPHTSASGNHSSPI